MRSLNVVTITIALILAVVAVNAYSRASRSDAALKARSDSADVRTSRLAGELAASEATEKAQRDSIAALRRDKASWRLQASAEHAKNDTIVDFLTTLDSAWVPKRLALAAVASLHAELAYHDSIITADSVEIETLTRMYRSADSGRVALWDALQVQRGLTRAWQRAAQPPLLSWRRLKVGPGCAAGVGGMACGIAVSYTF